MDRALAMTSNIIRCQLTPPFWGTAAADRDQTAEPSVSGSVGGQQNDGGQQGQQGDNIDPRLAQLKLLRGMQIAINNETKRLDTVTAGDAGAIIERQQQSLANRQGKLGDIVSEMFKPAPTNLAGSPRSVCLSVLLW